MINIGSQVNLRSLGVSFFDKKLIRYGRLLPGLSCWISLALLITHSSMELGTPSETAPIYLASSHSNILLGAALVIASLGIVYQTISGLRSSKTDKNGTASPRIYPVQQEISNLSSTHGPKPVLPTVSPDQKTKYERSKLSNGSMQEIESNLLKLMENKKTYLDSDLSLTVLAKLLEVSPHILSQVINGHMGVNFYTLINRYRIEFAIEKISASEGSTLSIVDLAMECGYKSKSSFYTAFKKHTNLTPSQFKDSLPNHRPIMRGIA